MNPLLLLALAGCESPDEDSDDTFMAPDTPELDVAPHLTITDQNYDQIIVQDRHTADDGWKPQAESGQDYMAWATRDYYQDCTQRLSLTLEAVDLNQDINGDAAELKVQGFVRPNDCYDIDLESNGDRLETTWDTLSEISADYFLGLSGETVNFDLPYCDRVDLYFVASASEETSDYIKVNYATADCPE